MSDLSNFAESLLLKWLMTDESVTRPTAWHVALYSAAPTDAGGGTELTGNGYARQAVDFGTTGSTSAGAVEFTANGGDWLAAVAVGIFDAGTSGNLIWHKVLSTPKTNEDGDTIRFSAGDIDLALD